MKIRPLPLLLALACATFTRADEAAPVPTVITSQAADARTVGDETFILFTGLVTVTGTNIRLTCDRLEAIVEQRRGAKRSATGVFGETGKFKHMLATGRVKIVQDDRVATCGRAEVLPEKDEVVLTEKPMVEDPQYGTATAHLIRMRRGERRVSLENGPDGAPQITTKPFKDLGFPKDQPAPAREAAPEPPPRIQLLDPSAPASPGEPAKNP